MNTETSTHAEYVFMEAPASWNTRFITPEGFECQITLRGETGSELMEKAASAITYLLSQGYTPYSYSKKPNSTLTNEDHLTLQAI